MVSSPTTEIWLERVAAWRASGERAEILSRRSGYAANTLRWWASKLKREMVAQPVPAPAAVQLARFVRTSPVASAYKQAISEGANDDEANAHSIKAVPEELVEKSRQTLQAYADAMIEQEKRLIHVMLLENEDFLSLALNAMLQDELKAPQGREDYERFRQDVRACGKRIDKLMHALSGRFSPAPNVILTRETAAKALYESIKGSLCGEPPDGGPYDEKALKPGDATKALKPGE